MDWNTDLINDIEELKKIMINVATWISDIQNVDQTYKNLYIDVLKQLKTRNIENYNNYFSLWDFYTYWKNNWLTTYESRRKHIRELYKHIEYGILINSSNSEWEVSYDYISDERIKEIRNIKSINFDLSKLIKILEEINIWYKNKSYLWVSSLLRMLIDHIPPIFWKNSFKVVVSEYNFSRSDKENMKHLVWWLKNISDWILHNTIWSKEVLPTEKSIEFRADFDILLKNIILELNKK